MTSPAIIESVAAFVHTPYFLAKPFTLDEMVRVLGRALEERVPPHPTVVTQREGDRR